MKAFFTDPTNQKRFGLAAVVLAVSLGGYALYSNITHQPQAQKIIPIVRTYTVGQAADAAATAKFYPGEVRGRYESQLAFQVAGKIAPATSTWATPCEQARSCWRWTPRT